MRVVFLDPIGELGGAERSLLDIVSAVRDADSDVGIHLICGTEGPLVQHAAKLGVEVEVLPMPHNLLLFGDSGLGNKLASRASLTFAQQATSAIVEAHQYARRLEMLITAISPDIIHSNGNKFHILSRIAGLSTTPVVFHLRDFVSTRVLMSHALRWASKRASHMVAISKAVADDASKVLSPVPISIIHNAIDTEEFRPEPGRELDLDALSGLPPAAPNTVRVGLVATYARWKGHGVFLDAAGDGPAMVTDGRVAALWGGGIGWPGFTAVMQAGGRFVGLTP
ncbi:MAG: glycosyltransferase, partial [Cyanobacteria bacterium]|nr:glycosyltransferase [Cyanobacteriota bacterium]